MRYAKIINGNLEYAPKNKGAVSNFDQDVAAMLSDGYMPIMPAVRPDDGQEYRLSYEQTGSQIREVWTLVPAPEPAEPSLPEQVSLLEAQTGLTRAVRELVLAENSSSSQYVKEQAIELENMAGPLRGNAMLTETEEKE